MAAQKLVMGEAHRVVVPNGYNVRDLGGYPTQAGMTHTHRFLRSGDTDDLGRRGTQALVDYGVGRVIDLRGEWERQRSPDGFLDVEGVRYLAVALYDYNISDPKLMAGKDENELSIGLASGYVMMLSNKEAVRSIFSFAAEAADDECVLFHCAAGMDRTGVTAMLLLALAGVDRAHIIADYCYSFGSQGAVDELALGKRSAPSGKRRKGLFGLIDRLVGEGEQEGRAIGMRLKTRADTIAQTYDRVMDGYGSVEAYLASCSVTADEMARVKAHLLGVPVEDVTLPKAAATVEQPPVEDVATEAAAAAEPVVAEPATEDPAAEEPAVKTAPDPAAVDQRKKELRAQFKRLRIDLGAEARAQIDADIAERVCSLPEWGWAQVVLTYLSVGEEVDTRSLIRRAWEQGKSVAIPRVAPGVRRMDWYLIEDFDHLETGSFGIEEPIADPAHLLRVGDENVEGVALLALVPALTFDGSGNRLGYGGGFYDTLLAAFAGDAVGLCRERQLTDDLTEEGVIAAHDQAVPIIVTEERTLRP